MPVVWNGTPEEYLELTTAVSMWCECEYNILAQRTRICPSHNLLETDQRVLNCLVFGRRMRDALIEEENDT